MAKPPRNNTRTTSAPKPAVTEVIDDSKSTTEPVAAVAKEEVKLPPPVSDNLVADIAAPRTAAERRMAAAHSTTMAIKQSTEQVESATDNPSLAKVLGQDTGFPTPSPNRPAIFDTIDATVQPFILEMMPGARLTDQRAGELHYSMSMLIKLLLNAGGNDLKVGAPYLFTYYRKYAGSVFHPQNHHRGVGSMRGTDADIDFYRNISRIFVDLSNPESAKLTLSRTDLGRFRKLTLAISSPAASRMGENLVSLISRYRGL